MYNNETTPVNDNGFKYINLDYMDMMSDGDDDMKKAMLEMLLEELPQELVKMKEAAAAANWADLGSISHKMKSTLSFVGNDSMTNVNKEIEMVCKNREGTDNVPGMIDTLINCSTDVIVELKKVFESL